MGRGNKPGTGKNNGTEKNREGEINLGRGNIKGIFYFLFFICILLIDATETCNSRCTVAAVSMHMT